MTEFLLTGGKGVLGSAFSKTYRSYTPSKDTLDVTDYDSIIKNITPDVNYLIHLAAITSVEKCENERELAYDVNVNGTRNVIKAVMKTGIKLIYISTPCVFDGKTGHYNEKSLPYPVNYYGFTKAVSEELIKTSGINHLILRTNFVGRKPWPYPKAFTDRFGSYLFADDVSDQIFLRRNHQGIEHVNGNDMSMFELARKVSPDVKPMTIHDYNGNAHLTMNMTMESIYD